MALPTKTPCENEGPESVTQCGRPAHWCGLMDRRHVQLNFCDQCRRDLKHLAAQVKVWTPRRYRSHAPAPGMFSPEADQLDWITEAQG